MGNKSGKTDKKAEKTELHGAQKNITKTKDISDSRKNSVENKMNNCKG